MTFNYLKTETYMDSIDIEDIGNCFLSAYNDEGKEWVLGINTKLGWTTAKALGPFVLDSNEQDYYFNYSKQSFEYSDKKIYKLINEFINNPKRQITQIFLITDDEFDIKLKNTKL